MEVPMVKIFQALLKTFFNAFLQAFINHLSKGAGEQVISLVNQVNGMDVSNEQKRQEAFIKIRSFFVTTGRSVRDSAINSLIEAAVLTLKGGVITK
jgi:hypothetical protein